MFAQLLRRQLGIDQPMAVSDKVNVQQLTVLSFNPDREIRSPHSAPITCLDIEKEGRLMLASSADCSLSLYDLKSTATTIMPMQRPWQKGHNSSVSCVHWYPFDTGMFVSGGLDCTVKVWDAANVLVVDSFNLKKPVHAISLSPIACSHHLIATATDENHIRLCDMSSGALSHTLMGHKSEVWSVEWATHSEYELISGSSDQSIRIWDIRRAGPIAVLDQHNNLDPKINTRYVSKEDTKRAAEVSSHNGPVVQVRWAPDGHSIVSLGTDKRIRLWDRHSCKNTLVHFPPHPSLGNPPVSRGTRLAFSSCGRFVFVPVGPRVVMYKIETGEVVRELGAGHFGPVTCVTARPGFSHLLSAGKDCNILEWTPRPSAEPEENKMEDSGDDWSEEDEESKQASAEAPELSASKKRRRKSGLSWNRNNLMALSSGSLRGAPSLQPTANNPWTPS